jgi:hypothetical protein
MSLQFEKVDFHGLSFHCSHFTGSLINFKERFGNFM